MACRSPCIFLATSLCYSAWWLSSACASSGSYSSSMCLRYGKYRPSLPLAFSSCSTAHRLSSSLHALVTSLTKWIPRKACCRILRPSSGCYRLSLSWSLICKDSVSSKIDVSRLSHHFLSVEGYKATQLKDYLYRKLLILKSNSWYQLWNKILYIFFF